MKPEASELQQSPQERLAAALHARAPIEDAPSVGGASMRSLAYYRDFETMDGIQFRVNVFYPIGSQHPPHYSVAIESPGNFQVGSTGEATPSQNIHSTWYQVDWYEKGGTEVTHLNFDSEAEEVLEPVSNQVVEQLTHMVWNSVELATHTPEPKRTPGGLGLQRSFTLGEYKRRMGQ